MADRHSTTTIVRPRPEVPGDASARPRTRPIPRYKQLVQGRWKRFGVAVGATVIAAAIIAALFVLPVRAWFSQGDEAAAKRHQLEVINAANGQLEAEVNRLNTDDGIREAARREIGYTNRGEQRETVLPTPQAPLTLPAGWPYDAVSQIIAVRTGGLVVPNAAAVAATTLPPTTVPGEPAPSTTVPAADRPALPGGPALP